MKKYHFLFVISILFLVAVTACRNCDCSIEDIYDDAIYFRFDTAAGQFSAAEIGKAYVVQYAKTDTNTAVDTITPTDRESLFAFLIGETNTDFENYNYKVTGNGTYNYRYWITDLKTEGTSNDGKCKCYTNTAKTGKVNGVDFSRPNSQEYVLLKK